MGSYSNDPDPQSIASRLGELPRWVEVCDLLLSGEGKISALRTEPVLSLVLREPGGGAVFVIGASQATAVLSAIQKDAHAVEVIAAPEGSDRLADVLPGWRRTRIIVITTFPFLSPSSIYRCASEVCSNG
jgi:hypothetical protein